MNQQIEQTLLRVATQHGTPAYAYFFDVIAERISTLKKAIDGRFELSFAIKSNPNTELLRRLATLVDTLDASSAGEVDRALNAGYPAARVTFSGPAKRDFELARAVDVRCGLVVCESPGEIAQLDALGEHARRRIPILIRINPRRAPKQFGVNMAGKPSQFGVDEEDLEAYAPEVKRFRHIDLKGFHIYSGTNSLSEEAIAENCGIFSELFVRFSGLFGIRPEVLVFGSGFGIPYHDGQRPLDPLRLAGLLNPIVDELKAQPAFGDTTCVLEMGRYLVGPAGYFLTRVVSTKRSRGTDICLCDGGFNNHLAAFGLMGTVIRRNWSMWRLGAPKQDGTGRYTIVGPLCTTIDTLAQEVELPLMHTGDVIAVGASGAYGLSASPVGFISHPPPREFIVSRAGGAIEEVTEELPRQVPAMRG